MLYPVMPIYLKEIGFSVLFIGILEGLAEATSSFTKGYFGLRSDETGKRKPFVFWGYFISAVSKPLLVVYQAVGWVFLFRTSDRIGKGLRTSARDAILADESSPENRGRVFGFHRALDTLGAVLGPLLALLYLKSFPGAYKDLFLFSAIPALIGTFAILLVTVRQLEAKKQVIKTGFFSFLKYRKLAPEAYKRTLAPMLLFALANSSDTFILLAMKAKGLADTEIIVMYILYNISYAAFAYPMGRLADRIGMKQTYILGLLFFAAAYIGFAFSQSYIHFSGLMLIYGLYAAATEGVSKAWISKLANPNEKATALGYFASMSSLCTLCASIITGLIWGQGSLMWALLFSAALSLCAALWMRISAPSIDKRVGVV
jgi:MFS family permease